LDKSDNLVKLVFLPKRLDSDAEHDLALMLHEYRDVYRFDEDRVRIEHTNSTSLEELVLSRAVERVWGLDRMLSVRSVAEGDTTLPTEIFQ
jgi:hypothetical protein